MQGREGQETEVCAERLEVSVFLTESSTRQGLCRIIGDSRHVHRAVYNALLRIRRRVIFTDRNLEGRRGRLPHLAAGVSFGGGQKVSAPRFLELHPYNSYWPVSASP